MTTICWDGEVMAGDSQVTCGGHIVHNSPKVIKEAGNLIGFSGDMVHFRAFVRWLCYDAEAKPDPKGEWNALVVTKDGEVRDYESCLEYAVVADKIYTIGSGGIIAKTAMLCGKNAFEAVRIACMLDIYSGGNIYYISHKTDEELKV